MNATNTETDLAAENASLKAKLTGQADDEKLIREKMSVGLTREQAISAIRNQREYAVRKGALTTPKKS